MEVWKKVTGFKNYEVSNLGNLRYNNGIKINNHKGGINRGGYKCFNIISDTGKVHFKTIHRLVAIEFIENINNYDFVNHIDKDKLNNSVDNLEWCNSRENNSHMRLSMKRSSKYTGVYFDKARGKWYATIKFNNKQNFLGRFTDEIEASNAYKKALIENNLINKYASYDSI